MISAHLECFTPDVISRRRGGDERARRRDAAAARRVQDPAERDVHAQHQEDPPVLLVPGAHELGLQLLPVRVRLDPGEGATAG